MAKTLKSVLAEARTLIPEQGPAEVQHRLEAGEAVVLIDVRDPDEYREGFIEPATNISRGFLEFRVAGVAKEPDTPIVLYCQTGLRSILAARTLTELGYQRRQSPGRLPEVGPDRLSGGEGQGDGPRADPALQPALPAR
jgi:rhodanese-related sulfurtransferase